MNSNPTGASKGNILIVDDTPENLQVLSATLSDRGYEVRGVIKGSMAIRTACSAPPDLILLDIRMPEMDGYEVCDRLKSDEKTREIPVIFISASDEVFDKVRAFNIGGVDYITKPFQVEEVLARVEHQLTIQRLSKQLIQQNQQLQQEIEERRKAEKAALEASKAKSEFVANMSHELRTPLNVILGFAQVMNRDSSLTSEQRETLKIISRSGEHLLELINDVLDLSKIEAGIVALYETRFNLYRLLDNLEEMFQIKATNKNLQLRFIVSSDVPNYIETDEKKLRSCLINLLSNAIKFTESGGVTLRVSSFRSQEAETDNGSEKTGEHGTLTRGGASTKGERENRSEQRLTLLFEVEDTGIGISPDEINKLFEAFLQTEAGKKSGEGRGLGLTITRKFVQLMGGDITVESVRGRGSKFKFNIQPAEVEPYEEILQPLRQVVGLEPEQEVYRILIVDDTKENRLLLVKLLQPIGFEVREAENGQQAVEVWENWQPHLICLDTRMPVMGGLEATQTIRSRERIRGDRENSLTPPLSRALQFQTIIIAITASFFEERQGEILAAGANDFVRKPFSQEIILEKIARYLGVCYLYEDLPQSGAAATNGYSVTVRPDSFFLEAFAVMPLSWVRELYLAASVVNETLVQRLIEQISEDRTALAEALRDLVKDFRFDVIVRLTGLFLNNLVDE